LLINELDPTIIPVGALCFHRLAENGSSHTIVGALTRFVCPLAHNSDPPSLIVWKILKPRKGERQFISIIDCRGEKAVRSYYSKWHELAHLLTLTDQRRFKFCRTHSALVKKDPEEALMEKIAGHLGYLSDLVSRHAKGPISFEKIADIRTTLCPESSVYASIIRMTKSWPNSGVT
jgi:hypothetical protein